MNYFEDALAIVKSIYPSIKEVIDIPAEAARRIRGFRANNVNLDATYGSSRLVIMTPSFVIKTDYGKGYEEIGG